MSLHSSLQRVVAVSLSVVASVGVSGPPASGAESGGGEHREFSGTLEDGTPYRFVVPSTWNGTVFVDLDFAQGAGLSPVAAELLGDGAAYGGTTRALTGWDIAGAIDNQAEALSRFTAQVGEPSRAVAAGRSMGGLVAAGVAQVHPDVIDGAVAMCGGLSGSVAQWNQKLDTVFALKHLIAASTDLPVTDIPADVEGIRAAWRSTIAAAQQTPEGRARIALAAAIGQLPAWGAGTPRPDDDDVASIQEGYYLALSGGPLPYIGQAIGSRRQIEQLAGGGVSWNTGVDYDRQFAAAAPHLKQAVRALYADAGLDLAAELAAINAADRISADEHAVDLLRQGIVFDGDLAVPVLTMNAIGDQISTVAQQDAYERTVRAAGGNAMLRQTYVASAGHCAFSAAEQIAAIDALLGRLDRGYWSDTTRADRLNAVATELGLGAARFIHYRPERFNR